MKLCGSHMLSLPSELPEVEAPLVWNTALESSPPSLLGIIPCFKKPKHLQSLMLIHWPLIYLVTGEY